MTAGVTCPCGIVQLAPGGLPGRRPKLPRVIISHIDVAPAAIEGDVVVAVARDAPQARIAIEGVTTGGVGDDAKIRFVAQVVDPRQWGIGSSDHIFATLVVEISVTHNLYSPQIEPGLSWSFFPTAKHATK